MINDILIGSKSWPELLEVIRKPTTRCFAYVDQQDRFLDDLDNRLNQDEVVTHLVIGFDKANTHLVGLLMDTKELIQCIQEHQHVILKDSYICSVSTKQILLLEIESSKHALKHMPIFQEALKEPEACFEEPHQDTSLIHKETHSLETNNLTSNLEDHQDTTIIQKENTEDTTLTPKAFQEEPSLDKQDLLEESNQKIQNPLSIEDQALETKRTLLNKRQKKTLSYLKTHKKITNRKYRSLFQVSHKTAHIELTELVSFGFILSIGSGRSTRYSRPTN